MKATERRALEILVGSGTEVRAGKNNTTGGKSARPAVNAEAADALVEQGLAYRRELKGKQPGYVASVQGRREL
jgi:hypothetical protein